MRVIGQEVLAKFAKKRPDARPWIIVWLKTVDAAFWESIDDVREIYPHADGVKLKSGNVVTVFNCKGNAYRLLCYVSYAVGIIQVLEVLTHSEYSKDLWKDKY